LCNSSPLPSFFNSLFLEFSSCSFSHFLFLTSSSWLLKKKLQCCYDSYVSQVDNVTFLPLFTIVYCYKYSVFSFFVLVNLFVIFFHFFYSLVQQCCSFRVMLLIWCFLCEGVFFCCVCSFIRLRICFFIILLQVGVCVFILKFYFDAFVFSPLFVFCKWC
jgi:hypothetical protein